MSLEGKLPALRPLEITPCRDQDGAVYLGLRDMLGIWPRPVFVSGSAYLLLRHLDGESTVADVQEAFRRELEQEISAEDIARVVAALDRCALLETPRFAEAYAACRDAYLAAPCRDSRARWPAAARLRAEIEQVLAQADGMPPAGELHGLIAPHLDFRRGAPCYAAAYSRLRRQDGAARYVILGTNHFGRSTSVAATGKDFETPLGRVVVDRVFLDRLEARLGTGIRGHEFDHQSEHSVELQVLMLQVCRGDAPFEIVPLLCPDVCGPTGTRSADGDGPDLGAVADALGELIRADPARTVVIAGADLSHVGQHFGDGAATTAAVLAEVESHDRRLLGLLESDEGEEFLAAVRLSGNPTRICSAGCTYALRRALRGRPCRVIRYHQARDAEADANVTCAAALFL